MQFSAFPDSGCALVFYWYGFNQGTQGLVDCFRRGKNFGYILIQYYNQWIVFHCLRKTIRARSAVVEEYSSAISSEILWGLGSDIFFIFFLLMFGRSPGAEDSNELLFSFGEANQD